MHAGHGFTLIRNVIFVFGMQRHAARDWQLNAYRTRSLSASFIYYVLWLTNPEVGPQEPTALLNETADVEILGPRNLSIGSAEPIVSLHETMTS